MALLTKGIAKFPPGTGNRWKVVAAFVATKNQKQVIHKAKQIQEQYANAADERKKKDLGKQDPPQTSEAEAAEKTVTDAPSIPKKKTPTAAERGPDTEAAVWTNQQQKQLEFGMREVPATIAAKERWIKIAESVDGKTAKECFVRFRELCAKTKACEE